MRKPREENPELARVLSRVNALMKHGDIAPAPTSDGETASDDVVSADSHINDVADADIPVLTEVYEGPPPSFRNTATEEEAAESLNVEAILAELLPLIRAEVKKAVRQELVNTEKIVNHRLESELVQTLLERLRNQTD